MAGPNEAIADPTQRRFRGSAKIAEYDVTREKLGEGTFGVVSKALSRRTGHTVALKKILMHNEKEGFPITALREVKLLKMLSHPNILRLEEMAVERQQVDEKGKTGKKRATLYMVTPYMDHDLSGMLTNPDIQLGEAQIKCYMLQLLEGLRYLHDSHILHRDMKAANILISNRGVLQIADFGLARHYEGVTPQPGKGNGEAVRDYTSLVVTRWYRPPELLLTLRKYTPAIDIWGVGCVFAEMFERKPILEGKTDVDQCVRIFRLLGSPNESTMPGWSELPGCEGTREWEPQKGDIDQRFGPRMGSAGLNLLKRLLCLDWRKRINAIDALQHNYFKTSPLPARPEDLPRYEDSHELDARRRGQEKQRALPPAPAGGTVGMGPDEWNGSGPMGYGDRGPPRGYGHGRDRGGHPGLPPRIHDDRRPPPPHDSRVPAWRHDRDRDRDRARGPPPNGPPPRPPSDLPPRPDLPTRGSRSTLPRVPPLSNRDADTYIPAYDRSALPYDRGRGGGGGGGGGYRGPDATLRSYHDPDGAPQRSYREADGPLRSHRDLDAPPPRFERHNYRDRDREPPHRARSRSPGRDIRQREQDARRERLQDRERDLYRR